MKTVKDAIKKETKKSKVLARDLVVDAALREYHSKALKLISSKNRKLMKKLGGCVYEVLGKDDTIESSLYHKPIWASSNEKHPSFSISYKLTKFDIEDSGSSYFDIKLEKKRQLRKPLRDGYDVDEYSYSVLLSIGIELTSFDTIDGFYKTIHKEINVFYKTAIKLIKFVREVN